MKRATKQKYFPSIFLFPVVLVYFEIVFKIFTVENFFSLSTLIAVLFGVSYSCIGYLLSSIFENKKINKIITGTLLCLTCLAYVVQYLIYKQFKQFYDIDTMTGGASDALTTYFKELMYLIFVQGGIFVILLFAVPVVLYFVFSKKYIPSVQSRAWFRLNTVFFSGIAFVLAIILVVTSSVYAPIYRLQYNFQSAVASFGLITGLRLDLQNKISLGSADFENTKQPTDAPTEIPVEYGYNSIDIDFEALSVNASKKVKELNTYVSGLTPSHQNEYTGLFKGKNLIMITAEAFTAEVIDSTLTPTLYRLATKGINFKEFYQPASAGTTGGEYQNIFGMIPTSGGMSFKKTAKYLNYYTMGSQLNRLSYYGKAFHNNSYTYYDRHKTHINLGYSDGFMGYGNGMEQYVENDWPQSDYKMISGTLPTYIDKQPFNVYYMSVSGHSGYSTEANAMAKKHWDRVKDLPYSDDVKGYLAANLELEDALTYLVTELENKGIADDTVICIATDHFPYGLDDGGTLGNMPNLSELYKMNVDDYFKRDHSALIIWSGCLEKSEPIIVNEPTFSLDILPTLSNLFGTEFDSRLMVGRDVFSDAPALVFNTNYDWKTDLGTYFASSNKFVPKDENTVIPEGYVEEIKAVVRNKIRYCTLATDTDYMRAIFG